MDYSVLTGKWGLRAIEGMLINYLLFLMAFQPLEEYYNCLHPNLVSELPHIVCEWEEEDFIKVGKKTILRKEREEDNKFEAWGRRKYWERKGR